MSCEFEIQRDNDERWVFFAHPLRPRDNAYELKHSVKFVGIWTMAGPNSSADPRCNRERDGIRGIHGACSTCFHVYDFYQSRCNWMRPCATSRRAAMAEIGTRA
jgi:hypothetical protein